MTDRIAKLGMACWLALALAVSGALAQEHKAAAANDGTSVYAELAKAPEKARAKRNPMENDLDAPKAGQKLYGQHCVECHGATADGGDKGPSLRNAAVQQATSGTLFWILTNGVVRQGMPVWSKLPEPQRWQIVTYLKSLGGSAALNR